MRRTVNAPNRHQLARQRDPLGALGITHGLEQSHVAAILEHIPNSSGGTDTPPPANASLWMN
jgi:hypothetical protein